MLPAGLLAGPGRLSLACPCLDSAPSWVSAYLWLSLSLPYMGRFQAVEKTLPGTSPLTQHRDVKNTPAEPSRRPLSWAGPQPPLEQRPSKRHGWRLDAWPPALISEHVECSQRRRADSAGSLSPLSPSYPSAGLARFSPQDAGEAPERLTEGRRAGRCPARWMGGQEEFLGSWGSESLEFCVLKEKVSSQGQRTRPSEQPVTRVLGLGPLSPICPQGLRAGLKKPPLLGCER